MLHFCLGWKANDMSIRKRSWNFRMTANNRIFFFVSKKARMVLAAGYPLFIWPEWERQKKVIKTRILGKRDYIRENQCIRWREIWTGGRNLMSLDQLFHISDVMLRLQMPWKKKNSVKEGNHEESKEKHDKKMRRLKNKTNALRNIFYFFILVLLKYLFYFMAKKTKKNEEKK